LTGNDVFTEGKLNEKWGSPCGEGARRGILFGNEISPSRAVKNTMPCLGEDAINVSFPSWKT